jgi:cytochrome c551/c552
MKLRILLTAVFFVVVFVGLQSNNVAKSEEAKTGATVFTELRCDMCHSVESAGIPSKKKSGNVVDLSTAGDDGDAAFLLQYLKKEVELHDKKHPANFRANDEDAQILVEWLATLKAE